MDPPASWARRPAQTEGCLRLAMQAQRACPAPRTFKAPTRSALSSKPHATHLNSDCVGRLAVSVCPQFGHVWLA